MFVNHTSTVEEAKEIVSEILKSGTAIDKLIEWVELQGGDAGAVKDTSKLPQAKAQKKVTIQSSGYVKTIDAEAIGRAALILGAGRETKESEINLAVGIVMHKKIGDYVATGDVIATLYYDEEDKALAAEKIVLEAYEWQQELVEKQILIYDIIV